AGHRSNPVGLTTAADGRYRHGCQYERARIHGGSVVRGTATADRMRGPARRRQLCAVLVHRAGRAGFPAVDRRERRHHVEHVDVAAYGVYRAVHEGEVEVSVSVEA